MINVLKMRSLYESLCGDRERPNPRGRTEFANRVRHWLGLCDERGNNYRDRLGNRILKESEYAAEEFSVQELAEACVGPSWRNFFDPSRKAGIADLAKMNRQIQESYPGDPVALLEAAGVGIDVSSFADINAWTAATGGLLERKILEAFDNPMYIGDELMPSESTKIAEGQKVTGVSRLGDKATERQPGEPHARSGLLERWVQLGKTRENALAVDVTKEAAFFDLTGQLLQHAGQHGDWIAYRREFDILSAFLGVTTQSTGRYAFNYKGTATNTYQTTNANLFGYISQLASNDLVDWKSVEAAWKIMQRQLDPETGTRVMVKPDTVVVNLGRVATADLIFGATETERRTAPSATQATTADLHILRASGNVVTKSFGLGAKVIWSPLIEQFCTNSASDPVSPGLGLTQDQADARWWWFQKSRFSKYMVNWPLTVTQAPASNYDMIDKGLVASFFGNERGMPSVWSPWHMIACTG